MHANFPADYEFLRELGGGPITRVVEARHRSGGFPCAVKILRPEWADDSMAQHLIRREARAGLAIRHPQLVKILDADITRPPFFVVMELLNGETLRSQLNRNGPFDLRTGIWITRQIAEALAAIHKAGFVHADVKPENIRLLGDGNAVLMDLGFAHRPGEHEQLILDGYLLATAEYLAPELCDFSADHTFASDWFSLGLVLYELLTGSLPYPSGNVATVLNSHREIDVRPKIKRNAAIWPHRLISLLCKMLSLRPFDRLNGNAIIRELIPLEISQLAVRRAA